MLFLRMLAFLPLLWDLSAYAVMPDGHGRKATELDFMIITTGQSDRLLRSGEEISIVKGDRFAVRQAWLKGPPPRGMRVHVMALKPERARGGALRDDRGRIFNSLADLKLPADGKDVVFEIRAETHGTVHGSVYIHLLDPILNFAQLAVNGETVILRSGEPVHLKKSDKMTVERVVTNVSDENDVKFQIVPREGIAPKSGLLEIRFSRGPMVFARIPLEVLSQ